MYGLATKDTEITSIRKREREFFETPTTTPIHARYVLLLTEIVRALWSVTLEYKD